MFSSGDIKDGHTKKFSVAALAAVLSCLAAPAAHADEILDLTDGDRSVTTLAGYTAVRNTGDEVRTLTVTVAKDETFTGTITGKIKLVKEGDGFLELTNNDNTYTGGNVVNDGRLIASDTHALGDPTVAIRVNADCSLAATSNNITCVVFNKQATFAYPVDCAAWSSPAQRASGSSTSRQYNIVLTYYGSTLSGAITGGGASVYVGSLAFGCTAANSHAGGSGTTSVTGDVSCPEGTVSFCIFGHDFHVTGKVTALGLYQDTGGTRPEQLFLDHADNEIGTIDMAGNASRGRAFTASAANALGRSRIYTSSKRDLSPYLSLGADQTIKALVASPIEGYVPACLTPNASYPQDHTVQSSKAVTLTMKGERNEVCDWRFQGGGSTKPLSLVWDPTDDYTCLIGGWTNQTYGTIAVKGGTLALDKYARFPNVPTVTVESGARLCVSNDAFGASATELVLADESCLSLPAGLTLDVASLTLAGTVRKAGLHAFGDGCVNVTVPVEADAVWTGAGTDNDVSTAANWKNAVESPDFANPVTTAHFAEGGSVATNGADIAVKRLVFDGTADFTLGSAAGGVISVAAGGITNATNGAQRRVTLAGDVAPVADQTWYMSTNVSFALTGRLRNSATPGKITIQSDSTADPEIVIRGAATPEEASDYAGDIEAAKTFVSSSKIGEPCFLLSGYEPLGPSGTLYLNPLASGQNLMGRTPEVSLTNAVISKTILTRQSLYFANFNVMPRSTNVLNGAISCSPFSNRYLFKGNGGRLVFNGPQTYSETSSSLTAPVRYRVTDRYYTDNELVFNGKVTSKLPLYLCDTGSSISDGAFKSIEFNAPSNDIPKVVYNYAVSWESCLSLGADDAFCGGQTELVLPTYMNGVEGAYATLDLCGHGQWFGALSGGNSLTKIRSTGKAATLRATYASATTLKCLVQDGATLLKDGDGTLTLANAATVGAGGTLALGGGTVKVTDAAPFANAASVEFRGGSLDVGDDRTVTVGHAYYYVGETRLELPNGTYSAAKSSPIQPYLAGTGALKVVGSDVQNGIIMIIR